MVEQDILKNQNIGYMEKNKKMTDKEKKIREEYGEYYNKDINENGWCNNHAIKVPSNAFEIDRSRFGWRPRSLQGIETNNGWTKIINENWLQWRKIDGSRDKAYIKNNEVDCLAILLLVQCKGETEQLFFKRLLMVRFRIKFRN
jgi:hypothetical protein